MKLSTPRYAWCNSRDIWAFLDEKIDETLRSVTLDQWLSKLERKRKDKSEIRPAGRGRKTKNPVPQKSSPKHGRDGISKSISKR